MLRKILGALAALALTAGILVATEAPAMAACNGVAGQTRVYNYAHCNDPYGNVISHVGSGICYHTHYPHFNPSRANNISAIMNLTSRWVYFYADSACAEFLFSLAPYTGASSLQGINNDNIEAFYFAD